MSLSEQASSLTRSTSAYVSAHGPDLLIGTLLAAGIVATLLLVRSLGVSLCRDATSRWRTILGKTLARTGTLFMVALAAKLVTGYLGAPPFVVRIVQIGFVVAFAIQAALWLRTVILGVIEHRAGDRPGETTVGNALRIIRLLVNVALFAVAIVLILSNLGVDVTGIVAGLGIGGIAIGLAARDIFSDLFAALSIIFDRPFALGETVRFGDTVGTVEAIGLKTTRLRSIDGDEVIVSNAKLLEQQIRNLADVHDRRVLLTLPLLNRNDPNALRGLCESLREIVERHADARFVHAWLTGFAGVTTDIELVFRVDTPDFERMAEVRHAVVLATLERVRALKLQLNGPWPA